MAELTRKKSRITDSIADGMVLRGDAAVTTKLREIDDQLLLLTARHEEIEGVRRTQLDPDLIATRLVERVRNLVGFLESHRIGDQRKALFAFCKRIVADAMIKEIVIETNLIVLAQLPGMEELPVGTPLEVVAALGAQENAQPATGDLMLGQGAGQLMGLRNYLGLAPIPVSGNYQLGGFVIRIQGQAATGLPNVTNGRVIEHFTTPGLVEQALVHTLPQDVQLRFAERAFEPQQQPVVVLSRIIEPILVGQQRVEERTKFQELMPVLIRAGQPAHLEAQYQAHVIQADFGQQSLKAQTSFSRLTTVTLVLVDHQHAFRRPAPLDCSATQVVLPGGRFAMLQDLLGSGLPDVHDGQAILMMRSNLGRKIEYSAQFHFRLDFRYWVSEDHDPPPARYTVGSNELDWEDAGQLSG